MYVFGIKTIAFVFEFCYNASMNRLLKEIADVRSGYIIRKNYSDAVEMQTVKIVTAKDFADNFLNLNSALVPADYQGLLWDGDLVMKARGNILTAKAFRKDDSEECVATSTLLVIRLNSGQIMPEFLELVLNSKAVQKELQSKLAGALVPTLSPFAIGKLEIPVLSWEKQEQAVRTLKVFKDTREKLNLYDDLVEKMETVVSNKIMEEIYE